MKYTTPRWLLPRGGKIEQQCFSFDRCALHPRLETSTCFWCICRDLKITAAVWCMKCACCVCSQNSFVFRSGLEGEENRTCRQQCVWWCYSNDHMIFFGLCIFFEEKQDKRSHLLFQNKRSCLAIILRSRYFEEYKMIFYHLSECTTVGTAPGSWPPPIAEATQFEGRCVTAWRPPYGGS